MNKQKTIAFDLDDVICRRPDGYEHLGPLKYEYCIPEIDTIKLINTLYDEGYKIVIYTARGMSQFKGNISLVYSELYCQTVNQLNSWGLRYHQLVMGKIHYDILVDDKVLNSSQANIKTIKKFL